VPDVPQPQDNQCGRNSDRPVNPEQRRDDSLWVFGVKVKKGRTKESLFDRISKELPYIIYVSIQDRTYSEESSWKEQDTDNSY
jgi:phenylacetate-coenzyme A ligase PaaK-like adenylate-forming protein